MFNIELSNITPENHHYNHWIIIPMNYIKIDVQRNYAHYVGNHTHVRAYSVFFTHPLLKSNLGHD